MPVVDQDPGVLRLPKHGDHFVPLAGGVHRDDVDPRRHHLRDRRIGQGKQAEQHVATGGAGVAGRLVLAGLHPRDRPRPPGGGRDGTRGGWRWPGRRRPSGRSGAREASSRGSTSPMIQTRATTSTSRPRPEVRGPGPPVERDGAERAAQHQEHQVRHVEAAGIGGEPLRQRVRQQPRQRGLGFRGQGQPAGPEGEHRREERGHQHPEDVHHAAQFQGQHQRLRAAGAAAAAAGAPRGRSAPASATWRIRSGPRPAGGHVPARAGCRGPRGGPVPPAAAPDGGRPRSRATAAQR